MTLQIRRGSNADRANITPAIGELVYTTDTNAVYVGDGVTAGGIAVGGNPFDQNLNTTSNVTFGDVTSTGTVIAQSGYQTNGFKFNNADTRIYAPNTYQMTFRTSGYDTISIANSNGAITWIWCPDDTVLTGQNPGQKLYLGQSATPVEAAWITTSTIGAIQFSDNTVQTTAYTGASNPFDQDLNTYDNVTFASVTASNVIVNGNINLRDSDLLYLDNANAISITSDGTLLTIDNNVGNINIDSGGSDVILTAGQIYVEGSLNKISGAQITSSVDLGAPNVNVTNTLTAAVVIPNDVQLKAFNETVVNLGTVSGNLQPLLDLNTSTMFKMTIDGNIDINGLQNAIAGRSATLVIEQDGTGGHTLTSSMKFAGGVNTLSTASSATDVISVFYDGTNYLASLAKGYV